MLVLYHLSASIPRRLDMVNESPLWTKHVLKDKNKGYQNNQTHKESWCNYCVNAAVTKIRTEQLNAVAAGTHTIPAENEDTLLIEGISPIDLFID
jgi:hypothetical protein